MTRRKNSSSGKKKNDLPKVHNELKGFDIKINSFGEITTTFDIDKLNEFLNRNVEDKKLKDRDDIPGMPAARESEDEELGLETFDGLLDEEE